ncbi:hypothetical protein HN51_044492 [Arachis hypogaea]
METGTGCDGDDLDPNRRQWRQRSRTLREWTSSFSPTFIVFSFSFTLRRSSPSPYVLRVKIALLEKGIEFQYKEERDVFEDKNKSELLLESNPIYKKVPVLILNGKPICESLIILEYIDEVWKQEQQLFSADPYYRAKARFWIDFFDKKTTTCGKKLWANKGEDQDAAKREFVECLKLLENELGEKPYFGVWRKNVPSSWNGSEDAT